MPKSVLITLTLAGLDTGPFNIYSDADGYTTPLSTGVSQIDLILGYLQTGVPDAATTMRVDSTGICTNHVDLPISGTTTTTSSSSTSSTTTTTTTTPSTTTSTTTLTPYIVETFLQAQDTVTWTVSFIDATTRNFNMEVNPGPGTDIGGPGILGSNGDGSVDTTTSKTSNGGIAEAGGNIIYLRNGGVVNTIPFNFGDNMSTTNYTFTGLSLGDTLEVQIYEDI